MNKDILNEMEFIISDSVAYLKSLDKRETEPSKSTKKQYYNIVTRLDKINKTPLEHCSTKNTFYLYRAAWSYVYSTEIDKSLTQLKYIQSDNELIERVKIIGINLEKLKAFPPDCNYKKLRLAEQGLYNSAWQDVKHLAPTSRSKKGQTRKLPCGWQDKIFKQASDQNSKYLDAIAVLSVTGCRPAEVEYGIGLQLLEKGNGIKVIIKSKKTHEGEYGQEFRSFIVFSDSIEQLHLIKQMKGKNGELFVKVDKSKNLSEAIRKLSKIVFTRASWNISAYNYRHFFCSNLKALKKCREDIAVAMGHSNDKSQRFYSSGKKVKDGFGIKEIVGTDQVKVSGPEGKQAMDNIAVLKKTNALSAIKPN